MLFGGNNGFNIFHPDSIKPNAHKPKPGITAMYINDSLYSYTLCSQKSIELPFENNNITLEFSAFDYHYPEKQPIFVYVRRLRCPLD